MEERTNIRIEEIGDVSVVFIDGNVLQENVPVFRKKLLDLVKDTKVNIVLDMMASNYISSMCLATIAEIKRKVTDIGGNLKLSRPNKIVQNLLEATNLIKIIETFNDMDAAVKSFAIFKK